MPLQTFYLRDHLCSGRRVSVIRPDWPLPGLFLDGSCIPSMGADAGHPAFGVILGRGVLLDRLSPATPSFQRAAFLFKS